MEDAVEHGALEERHHPRPDDLLGVDAGGPHPDDVVEGEPGQLLHDEHPAGDEIGVGPGHHHGVALAGLGEDPGGVEHAGRLQPEVELLDDRLGEQFDERRRVGQGGHRDPADQQRGDPAHGRQVLADQRRDGRALDLDHDRLARPQRRPVHLGDRGRRHGHGLEHAEHVFERSPEVGLDDEADGVEGLGPDLIAQQPELADELLGEDPLPGRDDLPELDVGRTQAFEGVAETLAIGRLGWSGRPSGGPRDTSGPGRRPAPAPPAPPGARAEAVAGASGRAPRRGYGRGWRRCRGTS